MKSYTVTMQITVSVTVEAPTKTQARKEAVGALLSKCSEFDRDVLSIEENLKPNLKPRKGIGSY